MMRYALPVLAGILIIAAVFFLPIEVPSVVSAPGRILPTQEWTLVLNQDDAIASLLRNHQAGTVETFSVSRFERGDVVQFSLRPGLRPSSYIAAGDTAGAIYSNEIDRQLAALSGELSSVRAALAVFASGEKTAVVAEAEMRVAATEEQALQQEKELARLRQLRARSLISEQDLEMAESRLRVLDAEIAVARARLNAVATGAKPEQLALTRAQSKALEQQIETLQERRRSYTLTAPISGLVLRTTGQDTLLTVADTSAFVVLMPFALEDARYLVRGQTVEVALPGQALPIEARLLSPGDAVHVQGGQQVILATARLVAPPQDLLPGTFASCTITYGSLTLRQYLRRLGAELFS